MNIPHFIHLSIDGHLGGFHFGAIMNNAALNTFMYKFCCGRMFSFALAMYLGAEWLAYVITLCLTFRRTARLFSKVAATFPIPRSSV